MITTMIGPKTKSWVIGVILKTHRSSCRGLLGLPRNLQCRTAMATGMRDTSLSTLIQYQLILDMILDIDMILILILILIFSTLSVPPPVSLLWQIESQNIPKRRGSKRTKAFAEMSTRNKGTTPWESSFAPVTRVWYSPPAWYSEINLS